MHEIQIGGEATYGMPTGRVARMGLLGMRRSLLLVSLRRKGGLREPKLKLNQAQRGVGFVAPGFRGTAVALGQPYFNSTNLLFLGETMQVSS